MQKNLVVAFIAIWFSALGAYANPCAQKDNLGRNFYELAFIQGVMDSSLATPLVMWALGEYAPYNNMTFDEKVFLKKAKERQKAVFAKKGLKWNEENIRKEQDKASDDFEKAVADCDAKQKQSVLD